MSKLMSFVRLDFITVKPYFTVKNLLIFAAVALFLTAMSGNVASGIGVGLMIGTNFVGYPFSIGEKSNMDALYTTLSVDRKNVVAGRYIFTLAFDLCAVLFTFVLSTFGLLASRVFDINTATDTLPMVLMVSALFVFIQVVQLPFFFKLGYSRAKVVSLVPFAVIMAAAVGLNIYNKNSSVSEFLLVFAAKIEGNGALLAFISLAAMCLIVLVSYGLSLAFYKKREF